MEPQPNDLKAIRVLYLAVLAGQVIFALIVTVLVETGFLSTGNHSLTSVMQVTILVIAAGAITASIFLFRKQLSVLIRNRIWGKKSKNIVPCSS